MKIYSLTIFFKIASVCGIILFFLSFFICVLFKVMFDIMVYITLPFILFTFIFYSIVSFMEDFVDREKACVENKNRVINIEKRQECKKKFIKENNFDDFEKSSACWNLVFLLLFDLFERFCYNKIRRCF